MNKTILWICSLALVCALCSACGRQTEQICAGVPANTADEAVYTDPSAESPDTTDESAEAVTAVSSAPAAVPTVPDGAAELQPEEIRELPGMIMATVHIRAIRGDIAPGLRDEDAKEVEKIIAAQTWGPGYDNLNDLEIRFLDGRTYFYETGSGILTDTAGDAVKLSETERTTLNDIFSGYDLGV